MHNRLAPHLCKEDPVSNLRNREGKGCGDIIAFALVAFIDKASWVDRRVINIRVDCGVHRVGSRRREEANQLYRLLGGGIEPLCHRVNYIRAKQALVDIGERFTTLFIRRGQR